MVCFNGFSHLVDHQVELVSYGAYYKVADSAVAESEHNVGSANFLSFMCLWWCQRSQHVLRLPACH